MANVCGDNFKIYSVCVCVCAAALIITFDDKHLHKMIGY